MLLFQAILGIVAFVGIAMLFSSNFRRVNWKLVGFAIALQFVICVLLLKAPGIRDGLNYVNRAVGALGDATVKGTAFAFGYIGGGPPPFAVTEPGYLYTFAFKVLPLVIVMSALSAVLWYWRVLPLIIKGISVIFERALGTRGPAGLVATANIFMGQIEAPLLVRPYLARMTQYELLLVMASGMANIAGSVMVIYSQMLGPQIEGVLGHMITMSIMSVPASILFVHVMLPEDNASSQELEKPPRVYESSMDAVTRGTSDGLNIWLNILAILIVAIALVALVNATIGLLPDVGGAPLTMERIGGWLFAPVAWLMGVPWDESQKVGSLLGIKTVLNEFIAYIELSKVAPGELSEHTKLITLYALCGFANFSSVGIQISGIGAMCPERRPDLARLGLRALVAATLACCMCGTVVGIVTWF
jgi:CNT family concentrative nucleoside transporter